MSKPKKVSKTNATAFFRMNGDHLEFGIDGPDGKETFDTCIDMIELLCRANVEIVLEFPVDKAGQIGTWANRQIKTPIRWGE